MAHNEPEICGCSQSEALRAEVERLRGALEWIGEVNEDARVLVDMALSPRSKPEDEGSCYLDDEVRGADGKTL